MKRLAFLFTVGFLTAAPPVPAVAAPGDDDCLLPGCEPTPADALPDPECCFTGEAGSCGDLSIYSVCELDPYCCEVYWDELCIAGFEAVEGWVCPPVFRGAHAPGDVGVTLIEGGPSTCAEPEVLCDRWRVDIFDLPDPLAVGASGSVEFDAELVCGDGGGGGSMWLEVSSDDGVRVRGVLVTDWFLGIVEGADDGVLFELTRCSNASCWESHSGPGCGDADIEACVCAQDAYCCEHQWDALCVGGAESCTPVPS